MSFDFSLFDNGPLLSQWSAIPESGMFGQDVINHAPAEREIGDGMFSEFISLQEDQDIVSGGPILPNLAVSKSSHVDTESSIFSSPGARSLDIMSPLDGMHEYFPLQEQKHVAMRGDHTMLDSTALDCIQVGVFHDAEHQLTEEQAPYVMPTPVEHASATQTPMVFTPIIANTPSVVSAKKNTSQLQTETSDSEAKNHQTKSSDSRLSAVGLARVLGVNDPKEALRREAIILGIFKDDLGYPLGYKTWMRDTTKEYRANILQQLLERVHKIFPQYTDLDILESVVRRATYSMMQSRLRRERRAVAKAKRKAEC